MKETHNKIREIDGELASINETIKYLDRTHANKPVWDEYVKSGKSSSFYSSHRAELMIYESAASFLKRNHVSPDTDLDVYHDKAAGLEEQRSTLYDDLQKIKDERKELEMAKQNVDIIINDTHDKSKTKKKERE